jgi:3'-phosphoadenosine 5'-phosphosulfate sulfotransferase (PAPS reductase)/FAD synthetase
MTFKALEEEQKKPLAYKVGKAAEAIERGLSLSKHQVAIAFSGGKDSTVLWHIIRTLFPEAKPWIIFGNTGVEYPESLKFARKLGREWGEGRFVEARPAKTDKEGLKYQAQCEVKEWLISEGRILEVLKDDGKLKSTDAMERAATPEMWDDFRQRKLVWPAGTTMGYFWCADQYGFPILGKAACKLDARRINIDCFLQFSKSDSEKPELLEYYSLLRYVKISQHCCHILKKEPSEREQARLDVDVIFKGLMASESRARRTNFCTRGYVFESHRDHLGEDSFYHVNPLQIWTDDDIWEYTELNRVRQSELYDMGYTDSNGTEHMIQRNGCWGCATGIMFVDNQMAMLRRTHPGLWQAVMKAGMAEQLQTLRQYKSNGAISIFDVMHSTEELMEVRPCVFDSISKLILQDDSFVEYDA